jgi:hypothetical protein
MTGFAERVVDRDLGIIMPRKLAAEMRMSVADLAAATGLNRHTLSANPASKRIQARLGEVVAVLDAALRLRGDDARAVIFFRHHRISRFGDLTPAELVASGNAAGVLAYLSDLAAGMPAHAS